MNTKVGDSVTSETDDWRTAELDVLLEAVLRLRTSDEAAAFFRDLCTRHELEELSHRWEVARLLDRGLPCDGDSNQSMAPARHGWLPVASRTVG
jgi:uncharacterized protein YerC